MAPPPFRKRATNLRAILERPRVARPKRTLQSDDSIIYPELAKFTELIICVYPLSLMSRLTTKQHEGNPAVKKGVTKVAATVVSRGTKSKIVKHC